MAKRLKVLISAYACEPGTGSEPEAGWQWAMQMARYHDVTVLTRANNRRRIEMELDRLQGNQPFPRFYYHDCKRGWLAIKKRFKALKPYYMRWQQTARQVVRDLEQTHRFDLLHHVTFAAYRYSTAIWGHGVASLWGPIGGIESIPAPLLPWRHPLSLGQELLRNLDNVVQGSIFSAFRHRARASTSVLASTREMQRALERLGTKAELMPTIGLDFHKLPDLRRQRSTGPLRVLYVGNLIALKGLDLALEALSQAGVNARFTLVGSGSFEAFLRRLAAKLGLGEKVRFRGRLPRDDVLRAYADYDVFLFPSLHDTGGYVVIEAMFNQMPVICLDCGGPAVAVRAGCGRKVPLGSRAGVIAALADALKQYDQHRQLIWQEGQAARESVLANYDWTRKAEQMDRCYHETVLRFRR